MMEEKSKNDVREIFERALKAVDPAGVVKKNIGLTDGPSGVVLRVGDE